MAYNQAGVKGIIKFIRQRPLCRTQETNSPSKTGQANSKYAEFSDP